METLRAAAFAQNPQAAFALRDHFLKSISLSPGAVVASYSARGSEINPVPLADALRAAGHTIILPVMAGKKQALLFRRHDAGAALIANAVGIQEPEPEAPIIEPDVVLAPLLAFDRRCSRLGTGGGYYDRTLTDLKRRKAILAVGLGFACQELPEIPIESHDVPLDRIVTELKVF
jgi:5-formyltetrahydrofolate cyclo-ligase